MHGLTGARRLGVLGWPVAHSRSPEMHNAALRAVGLGEWRYQRLPVPPELFSETVRALPGAGFTGVNVTIPHKEAALALVSDPSFELRQIAAVNTLMFGPAPGEIRGMNTDAPALCGALPFAVRGRSALILGAGGSARAAAWALWAAGAARVMVWNRTAARADALVAGLAAEVAAANGAASARADLREGSTPALTVEAVRAPEPADVLVNCTAVGLHGEDPFKLLPLAADDLREYGSVVDYVYATTETQLVQSARGLGVPVIDGLTLLVGQGTLAFTLFTGRPAPLDVMRAAVAER